MTMLYCKMLSLTFSRLLCLASENWLAQLREARAHEITCSQLTLHNPAADKVFARVGDLVCNLRNSEVGSIVNMRLGMSQPTSNQSLVLQLKFC